MFHIFVDANVYLDAFKTSDPSFQKHVQVLVDRATSIFVTQQVVDEVTRNKLTVAAAFVDEQLTKISMPAIALPGFSKRLGKKLRVAQGSSKLLKDAAQKEADKYFAKLATSSDQVSRRLEAIFRRALEPSEETLRRARIRKERGNPPGKKNDPLGDQISWEQFLETLQRGDDVFLATHDGDFCLDRRPSPLLSPFLARELRDRIGRRGKIVVCRSLAELVKCMSSLPAAGPIKVTEAESRQAAAVERVLEEDHDDDYDLCTACESDEDHVPHMVNWSRKPTIGRFRTGRCDYCDTPSVKCADCGSIGSLAEGDEVTCDCDIAVRRVVDRNQHGEIEADEIELVAPGSAEE